MVRYIQFFHATLDYMNRPLKVTIILKATIILLSLLCTAVLSGCTDGNSDKAGKSDEQAKDITYSEIDWTDLLPDEDLEALRNPPDFNDFDSIQEGSEEDRLSSQLKIEFDNTSDPYQLALTSKNVRPEFDGRHVRIPGFIVPLEFDDQGTITTFFIVPFFGACIHTPPPPPNQIIYAEYEPGMRLEALYDAFWINGKLETTLIENDMATAAYSLTVSSIESYYEDQAMPDLGEQEI